MTDTLFALGLALIVVGIATWDWHVGLVAAGTFLALAGWLLAAAEARKKRETREERAMREMRGAA